MRLQSVTAVLVAGALVVACSSDDGPSSSASNDTTIPCSITPTADVRSSLGLPNLGEPTSDTQNPLINVCAYPGGNVSSQAEVRYEIKLSDDDWATTKKGFTDHDGPITPIAGLGDDAFSNTMTLTGLPGGDIVTNTVVARKGSHAVFVVSAAGVSIDQMKALVTLILPRI